MMKCPLKFSRYEFEGGEECIGAECGFYGGVCMDATNGMRGETNGIADGITLPDGDAVAILRDSDDGSVRMKAFAYDPHSLSKLADMIERDYVRRESIEGVMDTDRELVAENIRLRAERDEWKAKAKTLADYSKYWRGRCAKLEYRSDKRAAAVERLRKMQHVDDYGDWVEAIAEVVKGTDRSNIGDYGMWESLIDLLTDEDAYSKAHSKTELTLSEQPEPLSDESDSREKLEDDIQSDLAALSEYGKLMLDWYVVMDWLDRQAAITKAEQREWWGGVVAELQAKVDELTAQLHASNAERARLRECLGIATDNAHDFLTLVDESGNVYDRDEGLA